MPRPTHPHPSPTAHSSPGEGGEPAARSSLELVDLALVSDELGTFTVPLAGPDADVPHELPEGAAVSIALAFRLTADIDGLVFETIRTRGGEEPAVRRDVLGGFRSGGPYEIRLPPERLPQGRAHCGMYEVAGRFIDAAGREHAQANLRFTIVHRLPGGAVDAPGREPEDKRRGRAGRVGRVGRRD
ncbi:hypothetical protein [Streptomyces sp. NPDC058486]|uniref:hypothetical protein n=1 Tax=unclassified Streptomyces TaxID=2593676 RepID=UPI003648D238